jgi:hypothetical protein
MISHITSGVIKSLVINDDLLSVNLEQKYEHLRVAFIQLFVIKDTQGRLIRISTNRSFITCVYTDIINLNRCAILESSVRSKGLNKTGNLRRNVILRCVHVTIFAVEKQ